MQNNKPFKVRDKRNKGWFYLDNEYLNGLGKYMGPIGIAVYVSLCRHADGEQSCFPAQEKIAEETGIGERTVRKYIDILKKHRVIAVEREKHGRKWAHNVYFLLDKTEWIYPESYSQAHNAPDVHRHQSAVSQAPEDNVHRHQMPTKDTNSNNTHINISKTSFAGNQINEIIEKFKAVNPNYEQLFKNTTQRGAIDRLIKKYTVEGVAKLIRASEWANNKKYAPVITTPLQLETKAGELRAFIQRENISKVKILEV